MFAMGKGKRTKGTKVALGDFIGESSGNTVNVGGKTVEMPSAPRASTLEIDVSQVFLRPDVQCFDNKKQFTIDDHRVYTRRTRSPSGSRTATSKTKCPGVRNTKIVITV